jgi:hypothetical protein
MCPMSSEQTFMPSLPRNLNPTGENSQGCSVNRPCIIQSFSEKLLGAKHWVRYKNELQSICGSPGIKFNIIIKAVITFVPPTVNFFQKHLAVDL